MKRLITVAVLVIAGCASPKIESGNFVPQFLRQLETCGAHVQRAADLPKIETTWEIKNDGDGFVVKLPRERFQDVNGLLRRLYGAPSLWQEANLEGEPQGVFS